MKIKVKFNICFDVFLSLSQNDTYTDFRHTTDLNKLELEKHLLCNLALNFFLIFSQVTNKRPRETEETIRVSLTLS
jgi:hypothetical protein